MEFLVEKIGMTRTVTIPATPVTLLKVVDAKVCEIKESGKAVVAYAKGKSVTKTIEGQQKKYSLSKEFNKFIELQVANTEAGDLDMSGLESAAKLKSTFFTKGRGYQGVVKRWNFSGGPESHGSRFHRRVGSIGNCDAPGRVQKGKKMPGHYGVEKVTVKSDVVSFDKESGVVAIKGSVPGANGAMGKIRIVQ